MTLRALPAVAAFAAGVQVATLRQWVRRGHISPPVDGLYDLAEIETYSALRQQRGNLHRAVAGHRRRGEKRAALREP